VLSLIPRSPSIIFTLQLHLSPPNPFFRVTSHNRCNSYPGKPYFRGEISLTYGWFGWLLRFVPSFFPNAPKLMPSLQFPQTRSRPSLPPTFVNPFPWRHSTCAMATRYIFISVPRKSRKTTSIGWLLRWRPSCSTNTAVAPFNVERVLKNGKWFVELLILCSEYKSILNMYLHLYLKHCVRPHVAFSLILYRYMWCTLNWMYGIHVP